MRFDARAEAKADAIESSNGWEAIAPLFIEDSRRRPATGVAVVRQWAARFGPGYALLDLACGPGTG